MELSSPTSSPWMVGMWRSQRTYSRRERYLSEDLPTGKVLSMEQLAEDGVLPDYVGAETAPSAEDCVLARESEREREELTSLLLAALIALEDWDTPIRRAYSLVERRS